MENQILITKEKQNLVDKNVRICIECGSFLTKKVDHCIYCKECGNFFVIRVDKI